MPAELIACLFISGFALAIGLTVFVHRQTQNILELIKRQQDKKKFIDGIKQRIVSDFTDNHNRVGRMDQHHGDPQSELDNETHGF